MSTPGPSNVAAATIGASLSTIVTYFLSLIPVIAHAPTAVQGAIATLLIGAGTYLAGWLGHRHNTAKTP